MSQYLLIRQDTVLYFKTEQGQKRYAIDAKAKGEIWFNVKRGKHAYNITNPYIVGKNRVSQRYNLAEVLSYVAAFE